MYRYTNLVLALHLLYLTYAGSTPALAYTAPGPWEPYIKQWGDSRNNEPDHRRTPSPQWNPYQDDRNNPRQSPKKDKYGDGVNDKSISSQPEPWLFCRLL
jgi:hypothetical protein